MEHITLACVHLVFMSVIKQTSKRNQIFDYKLKLLLLFMYVFESTYRTFCQLEEGPLGIPLSTFLSPLLNARHCWCILYIMPGSEDGRVIAFKMNGKVQM